MRTITFPSLLLDRRTALVAVGAALVATLVPVYRLQGLSWPLAAVAAGGFVSSCFAIGLIAWHLLTGSAPARYLSRHAAMHVVVALGFGAMWTLSFAGLVYLLRPEQLTGYLRGSGVWQLFWGAVVYAGLAVVARTQQQLGEQRAAALEAELQALRARLNPHFLFNTLHSLSQLAREDPAATEDALERFGALMRYVLDAGGRTADGDVALEDELHFVRDYLALERLRLEDRLRVIERLDPDALECAIPPLLLQPLVENAVRHGIAVRSGGGCITLRAELRGELLQIEISDDGVGAPSDAWQSRTGLGLASVRRLLEALPTPTARMSVATAPGAGFAVSLQLPARAVVAARQRGRRC